MEHWDNIIARNVWTFLTLKEIGVVMRLNHTTMDTLSKNNDIIKKQQRFVMRALRVLELCSTRRTLPQENNTRLIRLYKIFAHRLAMKQPVVMFYS